MLNLQQGGGDGAGTAASPIIDLRQYTLYPGTRDSFVELFDSEFVETQEAEGIRVIGQFRDVGDPNRFVWLRGFPDMPAREKSLTNFYFHSAAWKTHSEVARSMMIDSTDALLLRPAAGGHAFRIAPSNQRPSIDAGLPQGIVVAHVYALRAPADGELLAFVEREVVPTFAAADANILGLFVTDPTPNNFPRLPVREGEHVLCSFGGFRNLAHYHEYMTGLGRNQRWRAETFPDLMRRVLGRPQVLRLAPTSRSQLRP